MPPQVAKVRDYMLTLLPPGNINRIPGLLPHGAPGVGKTSASLGVLYAWGKAGKNSRFQDFGEFMTSVKSAWRKDASQTVEQLHEVLFKPDILLLDDIGKRADPEDQATVSTIVNGRINRGRPTICTTNCDLTTEQGRRDFAASCDTRLMERYRNLDLDAGQWGENLRKNLHKKDRS